MLFTPLAFTAAVSGLRKATESVAGIVQPMISFSQKPACREVAALIASEIKSVWAIVKSVQKRLDDLDDILPKQGTMIEIRQLVCIFGEGVLVLAQLESILVDLNPFPPPASNSDDFKYEWQDTGLSRHLKLPETVVRLQGFKNAIGLIWDILQGFEMPGIRQNLTFQTLALLKRDDKLLRRIKLMDVGLEIKKRHDAQRVDSLGAAGFAFFPERRNDGNEKDSDSNMPSAITLSDVSNLSALTIPISPKELADSSCHYKPDTVAVTTTTEAPKIHVERSKTQDTPTVLVIRTSPTTTTFGSGSGEKTTVLPPNPRGLPDLSSSCDAVFQLPQVTESVMAEFFRRAVSVSKARFAKLFSDRMAAEAAAESGHGTDATGRRTNNTEKLRQLSLGQLKELCVDVYDELVRRNKVDSYGQTSVPVALLPVKELAEQRNQARTRLSRLNDGYFFNLIWDCYRELEQRGKGILDPLFA